MRLGVFGGTFDPVHVGHLILAELCREQARLDQVLFVPAARPPHKAETDLTSFDKRVEMLNLALSGNPAFRVEEMEKNRPGPSYTVDTLTELRGRDAQSEFFLLIGADTLHDLSTWREPARILSMATLIVVPRPGWPILDAEKIRHGLRLEQAPTFLPVQMPQLEIASRELRRRVQQGQSIRYQVPRAVEAYIEDKGLYKD